MDLLNISVVDCGFGSAQSFKYPDGTVFRRLADGRGIIDDLANFLEATMRVRVGLTGAVFMRVLMRMAVLVRVR